MEEKNRNLCLKSYLSFLLLLSLSNGYSQAPNDSLYTQILREYANTLQSPIQSVNGLVFPKDSSLFVIDSVSSQKLNVAEPELSYLSFAPKTYQRTLKVGVQIQDSIIRQKTLQYVDTLSLQELKGIRKNSHALLKGDDPTLWGKWIRPALFISAGIGGIFALFFLRSD